MNDGNRTFSKTIVVGLSIRHLWGTGKAKTIEDLHKELEDGEAQRHWTREEQHAEWTRNHVDTGSYLSLTPAGRQRALDRQDRNRRSRTPSAERRRKWGGQ